MATDQLQVKAASIPKYETLFEQQLRRAVGRVRFLDVTAALLGLAAGTLLYALILIGLDRWLILSGPARQFALILYLLAAAAVVGYYIVRPFFRSVNLYYAAKRLEQTIPDAKNSVVNWIDLRNLELPGAIRTAVGQRAAHDAARADMDAAISGRRAAWAGGGTGILFIALLVTLSILGPSQFWSLLGRAFGPFSAGDIRTRTQIELRQPQGDTVVAVGNSVAFAATITGKVPSANRPDAPRLLFRYRQSDPFEERPLERERDSDYATTLPANQVHGGFWYKIAAGDAETEEYQVRVRATALIDDINVTYHYRPYLGWSDRTTPGQPNIEDVRGTEVTVTALANRAVRSATCEITAKDESRLPLTGELIPGKPNAVQFKFTLERDGQYQISFSSTDGDSSAASIPYSIKALIDHPPKVVLTKPSQDITLPANGLLQLEGNANDDLGVESMTLRMQVAGGPLLQPKPYRGGKSFKLADGGYPKMLEYKDAVALDKLKDDQDKPFAMAPKIVLEYWLEAADACDFPKPNVGESNKFKVTIGDPDNDQKKQQEQRHQATKDQQNHEKQQDQDLAKENQQNQERQKANAEENKDSKDGRDQNPKPQEPKDGGDPKADQTQKDLEKQFEKQEDEKKGTSKPVGGDNKNGQQGDNNQPQAGAGKDKGQPQKQDGTGNGQDGKQEPSQEKGEGTTQDGTGGQKSGVKKTPDKGASQDQGTAKEGTGEPSNNAAGSGDKKNAENATQEEVAKLRDQMNNGDGQQQENAAKQLANAAQNAKDQQAREDARKSLESAGRDPKTGDKKQDSGSGDKKQGEKATQEDVAKLNEQMNKGDGQKQEDAAKQLANAAQNATDPKAREEARKSLESAGRNPQTGEKKQDSGSGDKKPGEKATQDDVAKLNEQMNQGDGQKQEEAAKHLANAAQNATDPKAREEARKSLESAGRDPKTGEKKQDATSDGSKQGEKATQEDVAKLNDQMKNGDGQKQEDAAKQLSKAAQNATDPKAREEARKSLESAGRDPKTGEKKQDSTSNGDKQGEKTTQEDVGKLNDQMKNGDGQKQEDAAKQLAKAAQNATDPKAREEARKSLENAGRDPKTGEKKQDSTSDGNKQGEKTTQEDVAKLNDQMKNGDGQKKEDAAKQLSKAAQNATDPKAREEARKSLESAGRDPKTGEKKQESTSNGDKQGEKATQDDVAKLNEQMNKSDGQKQEDAAKQLAQAAQNAQDPKAREEARKALEAAGRDTKTGEKNQSDSDANRKKQSEKVTKEDVAKLREQMKNGDAQKQEEAAKKLADAAQNAKDPTAKEDARSALEDAGRDTKSGEPNTNKTDEGAPGRGGQNNNVRGNQTPPMAGTKPDERDELKKGELLLERFDKMLEKERQKFLEDAKISEQDMKRFREDIRRRKARIAEQPEKAPRATGPGSRTDASASQVKPEGKARAADTQYGGRGAPPPEFRETYREFTSGKDKK
jgi:hypothetical protein